MGTHYTYTGYTFDTDLGKKRLKIIRGVGQTLNTKHIQLRDKRCFLSSKDDLNLLTGSLKTFFISKTTELKSPETFPLLYKEW